MKPFLDVWTPENLTPGKTHRPSMSAFSAIFVLKENWYSVSLSQISSWGDHGNSVPDLAASPHEANIAQNFYYL